MSENESQNADVILTRAEHYAPQWDGTCVRCGHDFFECRGHCTCLACNAQRQSEVREGLIFRADLDAGETLESLRAELAGHNE